MSAGDKGHRVVVAHAVRSWLERIQTWLYDQVRFLESPVESHVICETTSNLGELALSTIHPRRTLASDPAAWEPMQRRGRWHIEQAFAAETQGRALADVYQELAA
jgi:hypothetical protein